MLGSIKETLRKHFAKLADSFETSLRGFSADLAAIDGPLEVRRSHYTPFIPCGLISPRQMQQTRVAVMSEDLGRLGNDLDKIDKAEQNCSDANVDENDYTVFTFQDLRFEFDLVRQALAKKNLFIENQVCDSPGVLSFDRLCSCVYWNVVTDSVILQIVSRNMTNLTPAQLEQFESTFRYFDKDETNTLTVSELSAALASLGIVYSVSGSTAAYEGDYSSRT